jgi:hypothetical protein
MLSPVFPSFSRVPFEGHRGILRHSVGELRGDLGCPVRGRGPCLVGPPKQPAKCGGGPPTNNRVEFESERWKSACPPLAETRGRWVSRTRWFA